MMKKWFAILALSVVLSILAGCGSVVEQNTVDQELKSEELKNEVETTIGTAQEPENDVIVPHRGLNQEPIPVRVERVGKNEVNIEMTAQITDIEIDKGLNYKAWTFNGEAPGPVIVVNEGDVINFTLRNLDPVIPHSMDFHAVHASPSKKFIDIMPNEEGTFTFPATSPGVFMYHCGTSSVLMHIANGMHGVIIVKPTGGYPTDHEIDKEFVLIQNEWYKYNDLEDMSNGVPSQVVFSAKALKEGDINTNGTTYSLKDTPLLAKLGDRIRIYVNNVGPNEVSSFHVVGTILDNVYIDGHPSNLMKGLQTVLLPASGGAVVEFTVTEEGTYPIVTHQFNHAQKGAVALLKVTKDGTDDGSESKGH
jgi:nitrite reductase (NO-forming)